MSDKFLMHSLMQLLLTYNYVLEYWNTIVVVIFIKTAAFVFASWKILAWLDHHHAYTWLTLYYISDCIHVQHCSYRTLWSRQLRMDLSDPLRCGTYLFLCQICSKSFSLVCMCHLIIYSSVLTRQYFVLVAGKWLITVKNRKFLTFLPSLVFVRRLVRASWFC